MDSQAAPARFPMVVARPVERQADEAAPCLPMVVGIALCNGGRWWAEPDSMIGGPRPETVVVAGGHRPAQQAVARETTISTEESMIQTSLNVGANKLLRKQMMKQCDTMH